MLDSLARHQGPSNPLGCHSHLLLNQPGLSSFVSRGLQMRKCQAYNSILVKLVRGDIINGEYELHIILPSLFNKCRDVV
jgi:hypothetical protein